LFKGKNTVSLTESTINNKIGKTENKKKKGHFASLFALKGEWAWQVPERNQRSTIFGVKNLKGFGFRLPWLFEN